MTRTKLRTEDRISQKLKTSALNIKAVIGISTGNQFEGPQAYRKLIR
jgi:hypothetical protein